MEKQRGQIQIVFILLFLIGVALTIHFTGLFGGDDQSEEYISEEEAKELGETGLPPVRSELSPSGNLAAGTKEVYISVTINEQGYCRYSTDPGQSFDSMAKRLSYSKDKLFHQRKIKGLKSGQTYVYYVRCRDVAGYENTDDAKIQFTVGGGGSSFDPSGYIGPDVIPPVRSNLLPTGNLSAGIKETEMSVTINEPGYCRYSPDPGQSFSSMVKRFSYSQDKLFHSTTIKGLTDNRIFEYFVRCRDTKGNENTDDVKIQFGVGGVTLPDSPGTSPGPGQDISPPYRFDPSPDDEDLPYYTKHAVISLRTDEKAVCRYSLDSGMSYNSMHRVFSETDSFSHSTLAYGLSEGGEYKYYIRCIDEQGNKNTNDFVISFNVEEPEDVTPPVRRNQYPTGDVLPAGTTETMIGISTNESAYCRYATEQGTSYKSMKKRFSDDGTKKYHTAKVTGLSDGNYSYFVRCQDLEGNANTGDVKIWFSVAP